MENCRAPSFLEWIAWETERKRQPEFIFAVRHLPQLDKKTRKKNAG